jgi:hypothetical protein
MRCTNDPTHRVRIEVTGRGRKLVCPMCKTRITLPPKKITSSPPPKP